MESNGIINALKRLERAGSETSRTNAKLIAAAGALGQHVAVLLPPVGVDEPLPRGYAILGGGGYLTLGRPDPRVMGGFRDVSANRQTTLAFADDLASGLLDELAAWLEQRTNEDSAALATLERAAAAMTMVEIEEVHRERGTRQEERIMTDHEMAIEQVAGIISESPDLFASIEDAEDANEDG